MSEELAPSPSPVDQPAIRWKIVAQIGAAVAVLWVLAGMATSFMGIWGFVIAGVLTAIVLGFGLYIWRLSSKSRGIVGILQGATDAQGRADALAKLRAEDSKGNDAINQLAQAQLVAQENPDEATKILEGIDIDKAPTVVQDDVRANLALMYLVRGKAKLARPLVDAISIDRQPQAKAKAMYAAICAECFSRTGKHQDALKLLEDYPADNPETADLRPLLLRAQVYTYHKAKKRGRMQEAMAQLMFADPNMVKAFVAKGHPDIKQAAMNALRRGGALPKQQMRIKM